MITRCLSFSGRLVPAVLFSLLINPASLAENPPLLEEKRTQFIEEILVTVTKREESIQEVASSVSAFSNQIIMSNNIQDYSTLADLTPGMITRSEESVTIRGVSKARAGTSPVAFHVNGFFLPNSGERFYDLASVEVLRGPSGTVYGKNATAGAINVTWRNPEPQWGLGGDYRRASFNEEQLRAYVNIPLLGRDSPELMARIAAIKLTRDGYLDNLLAPSDREPSDLDNSFVRIALSSEISDNLRLGFKAIRGETRGRGATVASPSLETRRSGVLEELGAQPLPDDLLVVRSRMFQQYPSSHSKFSRVAADINWALQDLPWLGNVDLDFMVGQQRERSFGVSDLDGTEEPIAEVITDAKALRRTAELRFTSMNDSGLRWLLGAFWYRSVPISDMHVDARTMEGFSTLFPALAILPLPDFVFDADVDFIGQSRRERSHAIFLNTSYDLRSLFDSAPDIELFAGVRQNYDRLRLKSEREVIIATEPNTGLMIPFQDKSTNVSGKFSVTTGEFGAKWFYSDSGMIYAKYAKGYKPGTVQLLAGEENNDVEPEFLDTWEIGWKAAFFNRSLVMNLVAFTYDYTDLQVSKIIITGEKLENAGKAAIDGVELELQYSPNERFYSQLAFSWLDARFQEFCGRDDELRDQQAQPGCTDEEPHNFRGAKMNEAPEFSVTTLMRYIFDLGPYGTLTPSLKFTWLDDYQRRPYDNPIDKIQSHTKTDLRLLWQSPRQAYKLEAFVENLENHDDIFSDHFSMPDPGAYSLLSVLPPRTYGLRMELEF